MAHRNKKPPQQQMDPIEKAIIGLAALGIGIIVAIVLIAYAWESLVKNLPWNAW